VSKRGVKRIKPRRLVDNGAIVKLRVKTVQTSLAEPENPGVFKRGNDSAVRMVQKNCRGRVFLRAFQPVGGVG